MPLTFKDEKLKDDGAGGAGGGDGLLPFLPQPTSNITETTKEEIFNFITQFLYSVIYHQTWCHATVNFILIFL